MYPRPWVVLKEPGQRKRDHRARRREKEWKAYRALWQKPIDQIRTPTGEDFYNLRRNILLLNRKQTARVLRCGVQSVLNWETGRHPVPFYAYLALQLMSEATHYRLASAAWSEWQIIERTDTDSTRQYSKRGSGIVTELIHPPTGAAFTPDQLKRFHFLMQQAVAASSENITLLRKVDELTQANTELRRLFLANGVTDEVHAMQDRLQALLGRINTATVLPLKVGLPRGEARGA